jgi:hypothetical protein
MSGIHMHVSTQGKGATKGSIGLKDRATSNQNFTLNSTQALLGAPGEKNVALCTGELFA